jgi:activator of HSP90 ATPase
MKKLLMVMTVAGFVACNNSADTTTPSVDSTVKAVTDSAATKINAAVDTATKKIDSTVKAVKDSLKK